MDLVISAVLALTRFDRLLLIGPCATATTQTCYLCSAGARIHRAWESVAIENQSVNCAVFNAPIIIRFCNAIVAMFIVFL